jgi:hypothetical protein
VTPKQAEDIARWLVNETRAVFLRALPEDYAKTNQNPAYTPALDVATLDGYCGFAQSFIDLTLRDCGLLSKPIALQTLPNPFSHVVLTSESETTEGKKVFLFDPTFKQFCKGNKGEPGETLANMPGGQDLVDRLLKDGFLELSPKVASTYLAAFNNGIPPFKTDEEAMRFFAEPQPIDNNLWFKRPFFQEKGYIGAEPEIKSPPSGATPPRTFR